MPTNFQCKPKKKNPGYLKQSSKKGTAGGITIPDFKLYYRTRIIKSAWYCHKNIHVAQENWIEGSKVNPHTYGYLVFDKETKIIQASSRNGANLYRYWHVKEYK